MVQILFLSCNEGSLGIIGWITRDGINGCVIGQTMGHHDTGVVTKLADTVRGLSN
jgi:hypothetical protein